MKQLTCTFFLLLSIAISVAATAQNTLKSYQLVRSFSKEELAAKWQLNNIPRFIAKAKDSVDVYEILYNSHYPNGTPIVASGLYFLPKSRKADLPLLCYNHGSELRKARKVANSGEQTIAYIFASDGYAVAMPDYFGLGAGEKDQIYMNAETEARASVDMLFAVKELNQLLGYQLNDKLFVAGYSQGGHAAMATHRMLQEKYANEFLVTASSPMSGPYDMLTTVDEAKDKEYGTPSFLMLLVKSYYDIEKPGANFAEVLKSPYDSIIPPMLDGNYSLWDVDKHLPSIAYSALKEEFVNDYMTNPENGFKKYLMSNNVFDWKPEAPMQLCYCNADESVNYKNSLTAYQTMVQNGSKEVFLRKAGKKFHHENCAMFAVIYTKMFFDSHLRGGNERGPLVKRMVLDIGKLAVKP